MSYSLAYEILRESHAAVLIRDPADGREHWIPFSQVEKIVRDASDALGAQTGTVTMSEWIAKQKGLK